MCLKASFSLSSHREKVCWGQDCYVYSRNVQDIGFGHFIHNYVTEIDMHIVSKSQFEALVNEDFD